MATAINLIDFDGDATLKELSERGVSVVSNVLTSTECDHYIDRYRAWLDNLEVAGISLKSSKSLIQSYRIGHFDTTWEVRLKTRPVFARLWKTEKLLTSADAVAISQPPEEGSEDYAMPDEDWFHLDQGAHRQGLHAFQGAVYLEETTETDHCFRVLENSHNYHKDFFEKFPGAAESTKQQEFFRLNKTQKSWYYSRGCKITKVPCPKGGMILWDARTVHDNCKPEFGRPNKDRWRFVVFVTMTPAIWARPEDLAKKYEAYVNMQITTHWASQGIKTFKADGIKTGKKPGVTIVALPEVAKSKGAQQLFGIEPYDYDDGQPNGPPEPEWN